MSSSTANDHGAGDGPRASAGTRVLVAFAAGVVGSGIAAFMTPWQVATLIGWNMTAVVFLGWVFVSVRRLDGPATASHATMEDASRPAAEVILIGASVASLIGVGLVLFQAAVIVGAPRTASVVSETPIR